MAEWLGSFKAPKFQDEKFEKSKDAYNKKNGYTITLPAWDDIIHLKQFPPLTEREKKLWTGTLPIKEMKYEDMTPADITYIMKQDMKRQPRLPENTKEETRAFKQRQKDLIPEARRQEIATEKAKKKARFMAMLASPAPKVARWVGSWAVAVDNAQDAIATLAVIGMITAAVVGGTTAAVLAGPVGWAAGTAALLNLVNPMKYMKWPKGKVKPGRAAKKDLEKFSDKNPFSKKARAKTAAMIKNFRPGVSNLIEALQVTDNMFGVGLSLGPITGLAQDLIAGTVRAMRGEEVKIKTPPPLLPKHVAVAQKVLKSSAVLWATQWKSDFEIERDSMFALNLATQVVTPYMQDWNPFDQVEDLEHLEIEAPRPDDVLTLEIIDELGLKLDDICNWPQNGERWISLGELQETTAAQATENLRTFAAENPNSAEAYIAGQNAHDFAFGSIEAIEGPGTIDQRYSHTERTLIIILDNGWIYPAGITAAQIRKFEEWIAVHEYMNTQPTARDIQHYAQTFCGFSWEVSEDQQR